MAIKPPAWAKGAHPTTNGWMKGRELLVARKISQAEIDEWNGIAPAPKAAPTAPVVVTKTNDQMLSTPETIIPIDMFNNKSQKHEEEVSSDIDNMSKRELEVFARTKGVELDRRHSKKSLLSLVKGIVG